MSNLSNLYISASYYGVVNLTDATQPFASQSEGRIYLHDGVGEPLGISLDYTKRVSMDNGLTVSGSTLLSGSLRLIGDKEITGSLDVQGDITSTGTISGGTASFDTVNARKLNITIESSSVIYNSGSNIFGDEPTDTQILSGSVYVPNLHFLAGNVKDTNLRIDEKLDTGSFNSFSSSLHTEQLQQDQNLDNVSASFATSQGVQDQRLDSIESFTASLQADFVTELEYSSSIEQVTSSLYTYIDNQDTTLQNNINTKLDTGSYLVDSASFDTRINSKLNTSTFTSFSSSVSTEIDNVENTNTTQQSQINSLIAETGSYVKADTNNTFTGDNLFSGSVQGGVYTIIPSANTASIDCSQGNFFTLLHDASNDYLLRATNITGGRTITCRIKKANPLATFTIDTGSIKFPNGFSYVITAGDDKEDVITFVSFDTGSLYAVASKNFV